MNYAGKRYQIVITILLCIFLFWINVCSAASGTLYLQIQGDGDDQSIVDPDPDQGPRPGTDPDPDTGQPAGSVSARGRRSSTSASRQSMPFFDFMQQVGVGGYSTAQDGIAGVAYSTAQSSITTMSIVLQTLQETVLQEMIFAKAALQAQQALTNIARVPALPNQPPENTGSQSPRLSQSPQQTPPIFSPNNEPIDEAGEIEILDEAEFFDLRENIADDDFYAASSSEEDIKVSFYIEHSGRFEMTDMRVLFAAGLLLVLCFAALLWAIFAFSRKDDDSVNAQNIGKRHIKEGIAGAVLFSIFAACFFSIVLTAGKSLIYKNQSIPTYTKIESNGTIHPVTLSFLFSEEKGGGVFEEEHEVTLDTLRDEIYFDKTIHIPRNLAYRTYHLHFSAFATSDLYAGKKYTFLLIPKPLYTIFDALLF